MAGLSSVTFQGGAKRLKALLKATMSIVRFAFQDSILCVIDHQPETMLL
jgi:hypothetical protein